MLTEELWAWGDRRAKDDSKLFGPSHGKTGLVLLVHGRQEKQL